MAPPTLTKRVPGLTGTNQPCGTITRSSSSRLTLASTVTVASSCVEADRIGARREPDRRCRHRSGRGRRTTVRDRVRSHPWSGEFGERAGRRQLAGGGLDQCRHARGRATPTRQRARSRFHQCVFISTASRAPACRGGRAPCRARRSAAPSGRRSWRTTAVWASCRPALDARPVARRRQVGAVDRHRPRAPDVAEATTEGQFADDRQRDTDRGERVVDQHRAAVADPSPAPADVGERGCVAVRAVDVEHVDRRRRSRRARRRRTSADG